MPRDGRALEPQTQVIRCPAGGTEVDIPTGRGRLKAVSVASRITSNGPVLATIWFGKPQPFFVLETAYLRPGSIAGHRIDGIRWFGNLPTTNETVLRLHVENDTGGTVRVIVSQVVE